MSRRRIMQLGQFAPGQLLAAAIAGTVLFTAGGCSPAGPQPSAAGKAYLLKEQPQAAISVLDVKALFAEPNREPNSADSETSADQSTTATATSTGTNASRFAREPKDVVFLARVGGGDVDPWDPQRAVFLVRDISLEKKPADEHAGHDDNCKFCQAAKKLAIDAMAQVQIVDAQGTVVATDARTLLGLQVDQVIVTRGTAHIDEQGTLIVSAHGIFIR